MENNASHIHINALHYAGKLVNEHGIFDYTRPVAKERAEELNTLGYQCYAKDDYTIKKSKTKNS